MTSESVAMEVRHSAAGNRYELVRDERVIGVADFVRMGDVVVVPHTEIEAPLRGRGLGAVLVQGVLDDIRAQGRRVDPQCWFVAQFIDEHPEYRDLVAP